MHPIDNTGALSFWEPGILSLATVSIRIENGGNVPFNQAGLPALASKIGLDNKICIR